MNAIEIKNIIDSKLKDIEKSIAFFCGEKYKDIILKVDTQAEKSVQRVKVKRVSAKNARK